MKRLSIRNTLLGSFLLLVAAMLLLAWCGHSTISDTRREIRSLRENELVLAKIITAANAALRGWSLPALNHIVEDRPEQMARYVMEMERQHAAAMEQLTALAGLHRLPQQGKAVLDRIRDTLRSATGTHAEVIRLSGAGQKGEAARVFRDRLKPTLDRLESEMGEFRDLRQTQLDTAVAAAEQRLAAEARRMGWFTGALIVSAGLLVLVIVRRISRGVAEVAGAAAAVTRDVLHHEISTAPATDETSYLKNALTALRLALETSLAERAAAQEQLRRMEADLAHAARMGIVGEMASGLAHELTQPLSAIAGYTEACLKRIGSGTCSIDALETTLLKTAAETQRAGKIIRNVRSFVRREPEPRAVLEVNELVHETLAFMDHEIRRRGIPVAVKPAQASLRVWGNRIELEQVIVNLVRNALEAMSSEPEPRLTIRTDRRADNTIEVAVADRGAGLSQATRENLFKPFYTTKAGGMGMGLVISRNIIENHDGRLWADINPDRGATFTFRLPAYRGNSEDGD